MTDWDKIEPVQKMQDYILIHAQDDPFDFEALYSHAGYSKRHADRLFKELLGKTPQDYLRHIVITNSAQKLLSKEKSVLEVALDSHYDSHEGYTRAFTDIFGIPPGKYKKGKNPIPLFVPYPIKTYYSYLSEKESDHMENKTCLCMIIPVERPKRKLIFMRSKNAHDYWSYCEEVGCDWEGLFNSIPTKFDSAAILTLPPSLIKPGYCNIASGVEVPFEYDGEIPENCESAELPACGMLYFQSQPFENDEEFFSIMGELFRATETFNPAAYGYEYADDIAPRFNFGGEGGAGAKLALPVRRANNK